MNMKRLLSLAIVGIAAYGCGDDDSTAPTGDASTGGDAAADGSVTGPANFTLRIENTGTAFAHAQSGVFDTPMGGTDPGPLTPGAAYQFEFMAGPGMKLHIATMLIPSNDFFYAPDGMGIDLFDENGAPITGDVTADLDLWDAGTEADQPLGTGDEQPQRNAGNADDTPDANTMVRTATADALSVDDVITLSLAATEMDGAYKFTATLTNASTGSMLGGGAIPLSPGVYVVTTTENPLFTEGEADRGEGLEAIAEIGTAGELGTSLEEETGLTVLGSPGAWAVTSNDVNLFMAGSPDPGLGLEAIAEDGMPGALASSLESLAMASGLFNTPEGASMPGPIPPGMAYEVTFSAEPGAYLHVATMFVPSNDLFFAFDGSGIPLFNGDAAVSGDVSSQLKLWDLGTEVDQPLGFGVDQVQNQGGESDIGDDDPDTNVREVTDAPGVDAITLTLTATPAS